MANSQRHWDKIYLKFNEKLMFHHYINVSIYLLFIKNLIIISIKKQTKIGRISFDWLLFWGVIGSKNYRRES